MYALLYGFENKTGITDKIVKNIYNFLYMKFLSAIDFYIGG